MCKCTVSVKQNLAFQWLKQCSTLQTTPQIGSTVNIGNKTTEQMKKVLMCNHSAKCEQTAKVQGRGRVTLLEGDGSEEAGHCCCLEVGEHLLPNCQAAKNNLKTIGIPTISYEKVC